MTFHSSLPLVNYGKSPTSHLCIVRAFDEFDKFEFTSRMENMKYAVQLYYFIQENRISRMGFLKLSFFSKYTKAASLTFL